MKTVKDLVIVEKIDPAVVFTEQGITPLLEKITSEVKSFALDVNTSAGRKDITSLAYKVSQSKTYLDEVGKELVAEWKQKVSADDSIRKKVRDHMDSLRDEIKAPLEAWETAEEIRVSTLKQRLERIKYITKSDNLNSQQIRTRIDILHNEVVDDSWQEFKIDAEETIKTSVYELNERLITQTKIEEQQAELEKLRREKAEQDEKIRLEAEAKFKADRAESEARQKAENERLELIRQKELAERRAKEAEEKFEEEKRQQKIREEIALRKQKEDAERAKNQRIYEEEKRKKEAEEHARREEEKRIREEFNKKLEEELVEKRAAEYEAKLKNLSFLLQEYFDRNITSYPVKDDVCENLAKWILENYQEIG